MMSGYVASPRVVQDGVSQVEPVCACMILAEEAAYGMDHIQVNSAGDPVEIDGRSYQIWIYGRRRYDARASILSRVFGV
jgi:hypothetical protein